MPLVEYVQALFIKSACAYFVRAMLFFRFFEKTAEDTKHADSEKQTPKCDFLNAVIAVIILEFGNLSNCGKLADSTTFCCEIQLAW